MSYQALLRMAELNKGAFGVENSVGIPDLPKVKRNFGKEALLFIRNRCEDLKFDQDNLQRKEFKDQDGRSSAPNQIPYNMEKDLDRLCLEKAIGRFLDSGSKEDAFDIYYCYCEIFKPFGAGYDSTGLLLELLAEHESNAGSLLMKHRDHYSHSVYVFLMGLALYQDLPAFREAYNSRYELKDDNKAAGHFLEYWGLTSLFHDIGYPFEIAHQQMKSYVCSLDKNNNDDYGFSPYVSYKNIDNFVLSRLGDLNELFADLIVERLQLNYLNKTEVESYYARYLLGKALKDRAVHENPDEKDYLYMDHAYFSSLILMKTYLEKHKEIKKVIDIPVALKDALCAIMLHNSLFKFTLRSLLHTKQPLSLRDKQPLSYLLMLCDELQCWDRTSYGQNSREDIYAYDFDLEVDKEGKIKLKYFFDQNYEDKVLKAKSYKQLQYSGYTKKSGVVRNDRCKFLDDISEIVSLSDLFPEYQPDLNQADRNRIVTTCLEAKQKKTGLYLSNSNYLNLYEFALALNGRYSKVDNIEQMTKDFEEKLSLEYKLSNLAQAKGFASQLNTIGCFYTDRAVDYAPVYSFKQLIQLPGHQNDLEVISQAEHERWVKEKEAMGWRYGEIPLNNGKVDKSIREKLRLHPDIIPYEKLTKLEQRKDTEPLEHMVELLRLYDGLTIYWMY